MKNFLLYFLLIYSFIIFIPARNIGILPYDLIMVITMVITAIVASVTASRDNWSNLNSDLFYLISFWLFISLLELANPNANILGAISEIKTTAVYPFLVVLISFLVFRSKRQLDVFLVIIVAFSTLGALYGIKQLHIGLSNADRAFVDVNPTHLIWGRLRVFSFYNDAGQFGASQAGVGLITLILSLGPFKKTTKMVLFVCFLLIFYGMLISGTRGALFALLVGGATAIVIMKNVKAMIIGGIILVGFFCFLKFTHIGDANYQIFRLRTAVNPQDASLNVRYETQRALKEYMSSRPFGGGLGVLGFNARYNEGQYLAKVQPDSYFVKVWAMYGIVGLTIWICIMVYILGKCCGIVWNIKDKGLKIKMVALTSGYAGILFCSYGNEVINNIPSSIIVYFSWVLIFKSAKLEELKNINLLIK